MADEVLSLHIIVIGAGMGGLGTALALAKKGFKHVDVFEAASNLGFVGAGIQMAPNLARILERFGCWADIEKEATIVKEASIRKGETDEELIHVDMPNIREQYGFPHAAGHRSSLAGGLYAACLREPAVQFHFSTSLVGIESFGPAPRARVRLQPRGGAAYEAAADAVLCADGIKSAARAALLAAAGHHGARVEDTGQAAYRIMLRREQLAGEPELLALLAGDQVTRWIGEKRHLICYPVAGHAIYNVSTVQPDVNFAAAPSATYTTRGSKAAMEAVFADFCPLVRRMLALVPAGGGGGGGEGEGVCEWKLRVHAPLPTWTRGTVALVGDACHPTLPHLNQGAAMAVEDGATAAECLGRARTPADVPACLRVYERCRKERTATLVDLAAFSGRTLHLGEGAAREERDRQFAAARESKGKGEAAAAAVPDKWASPDVQRMIYSHDCVQEAAENFDTFFAELDRAG